MKPEYHEGPEALEKFHKLATKLFRAPKPTAKEAPKQRANRRKPAKVSVCADHALADL